MRKETIRKLAVALSLALTATVFGTAGVAQAKGVELASRGNLIYRDNGTNPEVYGEDFTLLKEKLDSIPDEVFSPAYYAHVHLWEYRDVNERTHTKHCEQCGEAFDLTNMHLAMQEESCAITSQGKEYPGRQYSCECGRQWVLEAAHTLIFELVDETCHRSRCALDDTDYCQGYEPILEEHYAYYYVSESDGTHHKKNCLDCAYQTEEECEFTLESWDEEIEPDASVRYCACGNSRRIEGSEMAEPEAAGSEMPESETTESEKSENESEDKPNDSVSENSISENALSENLVPGNTIITEEEAGNDI